MKIRSIVAVVVATGFAGFTTASSTEAASGVSYCFSYPNGDAYSNAATFLQLDDEGWRTVAAGTSDVSGCGSFDLRGEDRGYEARLVAETHDRYSNGIEWQWLGLTPLTADAGDADADLGTGAVSSVPIIRRPLLF